MCYIDFRMDRLNYLDFDNKMKDNHSSHNKIQLFYEEKKEFFIEKCSIILPKTHGKENSW
jgi:hypothetical protein